MAVRRLALVAGVVSLFAMSACGASAEEIGVASAAGTGGATSAAPSASPTASSDPLKFAQCMREHGIEMEDPESNGGIRIKVNPKNKDKLRDAQKECGKYMQGGLLGGKPSEADRDQMLKLAQCLREHGLDVPDPEPGGGIMIRGEKGQGPDSEKFKAAHKACERYAPGGSTAKAGAPA